MHLSGEALAKTDPFKMGSRLRSSPTVREGRGDEDEDEEPREARKMGTG